MQSVSIKLGRILLRDFTESDRAAFVRYQTDPRYRQLYDFGADPERPSKLFDLFLQWQREAPRLNLQLGIFELATGLLVGCGGLRRSSDDVAVLGIELAPGQWGRFRLALDSVTALLRYGFETLHLRMIVGDTASGNRRVEKLARWFGAEVITQRAGPAWMQARGWQEVDWAITREKWDQARPPRARN